MKREEELWLPDSLKPVQTWLCLWQDEHGKYIVNEDYEFLSVQTIHKNSPTVESHMRDAVRAHGVVGGKAVWRKGRKISKMEWEDEMERMLEGKIPDEQEARLAALEDKVNEKNELPRKG